METGSRLYRSKSDRVLCGVSGGLAEYFGVDPALIRLGWLVATCLTFGAAPLGYIVLCLLVPERVDGVAEASSAGLDSRGVPDPGKDEDMTEEVRVLLNVRQELGPEYDDELLDSFVDRVEERARSRRSPGAKPGRGKESRNRVIVPWLLMGAGAVVLAASLGSFSWIVWVVLCPLLLVGAGALALARASGSEA